MKLYIENEQSIAYSKTNSPKFNDRDDWYCQKAVVNGKETKFYSSDRYKYPSGDDMLGRIFGRIFGSGNRGYYLYFQLDSQWYKMDALQEINYYGECLDVTEYIDYNGTFTTDRMNERLDGVELSDIAQIELLSENLERIMKKINGYNPSIEVRVKDGRLLLVDKSQGDYIITNRKR